MITGFKKNKWYNLGDVDHRIYGGMFIKRETPCKGFESNGDSFEIVQVRNNAEDNGGTGYTVNSRDEPADYLQRLWDDFIAGRHVPVAEFADWKIFKDMDEEDRLFYLAADQMSYYGGACDDSTGTNYWDLLGTQGISRSAV